MLADNHHFLRKFFRNPGATGAVAPATPALSRSVARTVQEAYARHGRSGPAAEILQLLELGAGTGALTRGISRFRPVLVERDPGWAGLLRHRFPALEVRELCATQVLQRLDAPAGIVSSIPLLNNPESDGLKGLIADRYAAGLIRFFVLYTYGWWDPLAGSGFRQARRASFVARSLPPAHVWIYE